MKKLFLCVAWLLLFFNGRAQQFWTTVGAGPWEAYNVTGTPAGWPIPTALPGWGNPIPGWGNAGEFWSIENLFPVGVKPVTDNFVWAIDTVPRTTYYRLKYTVPQGDCRRAKIHICSDEDRWVYVNGTLVEQSVTATPWSEFRTVDVTDKLHCGENIISVQVRNTSSYYLLVACFEVTAETVSPYPLNPTAGVSCEHPNIYLDAGTAAAGPDVTFRWTGPGGFTSTQKNPTVTPVVAGTYTCTAIKAPCCTLTKSITVTPATGCCTANIQATRRNCNDFTFALNSSTVNFSGWYWTVDGTVMQHSGIFSHILPPGPHRVCAHYLGTAKNDPNKICCEEECIDINIPHTQEQTEHLTYCPINGNNQLSFNPCDYAPAAVNFRYVVQRRYFNSFFIPITDTLPAPCVPISVTQNNEYRVVYLDENGCVLKRLTFDVMPRTVTTTACFRSVEAPCDMAVSPEGILPDCPECLAMVGTSLPPPTITTSYNFATETGTYERQYIDEVNCKICIFSFEVIGRFDCRASAQFNIVQNGPFNFTLVSTSTGNGTLFGGIWKVDSEPPVYVYNNILPHTRPFGPGQHRVCLHVTYLKCGRECVDEICYTFFVNAAGNIEWIDQRTAAVDPPEREPARVEDETFALHIVPNPSSALFRLQFGDKNITKYDRVEIRTSEGKTLLTKTDVAADYEYNLGGNANGIYYVQVLISGKAYSEKLVLQR